MRSRSPVISAEIEIITVNYTYTSWEPTVFVVLNRSVTGPVLTLTMNVLEHDATPATQARPSIAVINARRRNEHSICGRLPPDCWQEIFLYVRADCPPLRIASMGEESKEHKYFIGWSRLSHVCHLLREVRLLGRHPCDSRYLMISISLLQEHRHYGRRFGVPHCVYR